MTNTKQCNHPVGARTEEQKEAELPLIAFDLEDGDVPRVKGTKKVTVHVTTCGLCGAWTGERLA